MNLDSSIRTHQLWDEKRGQYFVTAKHIQGRKCPVDLAWATHSHSLARWEKKNQRTNNIKIPWQSLNFILFFGGRNLNLLLLLCYPPQQKKPSYLIVLKYLKLFKLLYDSWYPKLLPHGHRVPDHLIWITSLQIECLDGNTHPRPCKISTKEFSSSIVHSDSPNYKKNSLSYYAFHRNSRVPTTLWQGCPVLFVHLGGSIPKAQPWLATSGHCAEFSSQYLTRTQFVFKLDSLYTGVPHSPESLQLLL